MKPETADSRHVWHPFTQHNEYETSILIGSARGVWLHDARGRRYLDGVSSLWTNLHGHRHPRIDSAIRRQLGRVAHTTLLGAGNPPSALLAERLANIAPGDMSRVFYSDSGSTAVEAALKIAYQYWRNRGVRGKKRFLSLREGYHGDTLGAVSVGGIEMFHERFADLLFPGYRAPTPHAYRCPIPPRDHTPEECAAHCAEAARRTLKKHHREIAGFILEPRVQGAAGMLVQPPGYLERIQEIHEEFPDVLLIADEVATGFGRTGKMFASEWGGLEPDMVCLAKGITGGYLPLAATLTTERIFRAFRGDYETRTFFHGHTYTGNPLACAAALASLDIFKRERVLARMQLKIRYLAQRLAPLHEHPHVGEIRQCGFMVGIELVRDRETREEFPIKERVGHRVCLAARKKGVLIRPLGNVVVLNPPLATEKKEMDRLVYAAGWGVKRVLGEPSPAGI
ncbi:MAG: adenosylmethionine--8-amino-7-oxononanoate transaminase [Euryarchaeota archaeon]|nr:adenosylmethionine--8-amino-7-oxononanoate transaminase [Euryarchaeota archaeon]